MTLMKGARKTMKEKIPSSTHCAGTQNLRKRICRSIQARQTLYLWSAALVRSRAPGHSFTRTPFSFRNVVSEQSSTTLVLQKPAMPASSKVRLRTAMAPPHGSVRLARACMRRMKSTHMV